MLFKIQISDFLKTIVFVKEKKILIFFSQVSVATPLARSGHTLFYKCTIYEHTAHNRINFT